MSATDGRMLATGDGSRAVRERETASSVATLRVALIGYGEVGGIFGAALVAARAQSVTAFDILLDDARGRRRRRSAPRAMASRSRRRRATLSRAPTSSSAR